MVRRQLSQLLLDVLLEEMHEGVLFGAEGVGDALVWMG